MNAPSFRTIRRRQNLAALTVFLLLSLVAVFGFSAGAAQSPAKGERAVEDKLPKHLPVKVKVRKPEKVKDIENENWFDDLEVKVTNTGSKPIYYFSMSLHLPDVLAEDGRHYGYKLRYGRVRLADFAEPVQPDDVPIRPGESVTIKGHPDEIEGWKLARAKGRLTNPRKLVFEFQEINHGDGTGFVGYDGTPIPVRRGRSFTAPRSEDDNNVDRAACAADPPRNYFPELASLAMHLPPPVSLLPAAFLNYLRSEQPRRGTFAAIPRAMIARG